LHTGWPGRNPYGELIAKTIASNVSSGERFNPSRDKEFGIVNTSTQEKLTQRQHQIIFVSAPAGLGHLRVTHALFQRLPETVNPVVLGREDQSIQTLHRITSVQPVARGIFEWFQSGPFASQSNRLYRSSLRAQNGALYQELARLIDQRYEPLTEILVVATHFGLAHKVAAIKEKLQREKNITVRLAVIVTDDTFQHIWYVDGADVLVVPSAFIQKKYLEYGIPFGGRERVEVLPYPMSQTLEKKLSAAEMKQKVNQVNPKSREAIQVSLPVSGAAVGIEFGLNLMNNLREKSERFRFHIVSKDAPYTKTFLGQITEKPGFEIHSAGTDRGVVEEYDRLLDQHVISLEVTKPSEQSFKAFFGTKLRGGAIMLFSEPVGQQELDNLAFLERTSLIPPQKINEQLWEMAAKNIPFDKKHAGEFLKAASRWRAIQLPRDAQQAADFIWWMQTNSVFSLMMVSNADFIRRDSSSKKTIEDSVDRFWNLVTSF
jgi:hypothetical protein